MEYPFEIHSAYSDVSILPFTSLQSMPNLYCKSHHTNYLFACSIIAFVDWRELGRSIVLDESAFYPSRTFGRDSGINLSARTILNAVRMILTGISHFPLSSIASGNHMRRRGLSGGFGWGFANSTSPNSIERSLWFPYVGENPSHGWRRNGHHTWRLKVNNATFPHSI